jgi:hypothetical protein
MAAAYDAGGFKSSQLDDTERAVVTALLKGVTTAGPVANGCFACRQGEGRESAQA